MLNFKLQEDYFTFAKKLKQYASSFNPCVILDSCNLSTQFYEGNFKIIVGFGGNRVFEPQEAKLDLLNSVFNEKSWYFGVLGYNLKNEIENLISSNDKCFGWNELCFFKPETIITVDFQNNLIIYGENPEIHFKKINDYQIQTQNRLTISKIKPPKINKTDYISKVKQIKNEITNGNVYELNLCERFLYDEINLQSPISFFNNLTSNSPTPFSAFFALQNKYVMSVSPERFLSKNKNHLVSQPIKGTIARAKSESEDILNKKKLQNSEKDKAENVMIVDLVRNDLAKVSVPGTVRVDELFGIYSYSQVHQMSSTISSLLKENISFMEIIKATFPMGSMTGTPKIAAMQQIEKFENFDREWYSGSLGYITPWGDFDFNVLIRTVFYDRVLKKIAYYSGGAITIDSEPEEEFNELYVKVEAIQKLLTEPD